MTTLPMRLSYLLRLAILLLSIQPTVAQSPIRSVAPIFDAASRMVLIPTTVLDRKSASVNGLSSESFVVTQDNIPQRIASFGEQDAPVSIGVVLDTSGSMTRVLGEARTLLRG